MAKPKTENPAKRLNAGDVRAALKARFCQPEYGIVFEIARSTGYGANRHLDALAMDLWPSRGLAIHGIEIKVSRADFRSEVKNPAKAEEIAEFCDYFWIAAPVGIVPIEEVPAAWGLYEVHENGRMSIRKTAEKTESKPVNRAFMAAIMRGTGREICGETLDSVIRTERERLKIDHQQQITKEAEKIAGLRSRNAASYESMVRALGEDPTKYFSDAGIVEAIKAVRKSGVVGVWSSLKSLSEQAKRIHKDTSEALKVFGEDKLT